MCFDTVGWAAGRAAARKTECCNLLVVVVWFARATILVDTSMDALTSGIVCLEYWLL